jgi:hypothetical protein
MMFINWRQQDIIDQRRTKVFSFLLRLSSAKTALLDDQAREAQAVLTESNIKEVSILSSWLPMPLAAIVDMDDPQGTKLDINEEHDGEMTISVFHSSRTYSPRTKKQ